ncbi:helix-turn-helix domain-containing protein [Fulvivirga sp. M361]|uniref:helix-turn-helix domain-containing protein n=1 Tax=Fulvivirga sp. M361 TaxID=2594266 RepID=UPI00117B2C57|nr:AraC family transcriptional regulator [Fulvivirga sp. M361]TRX60646.1 helix-turn-helix domain-containing protein [Fulvivirga sp. M361]
MKELKHFSTLAAYCKGINISPPRWELFDIRSFEENMKTVHPKMLPFKHEFYAIAVKIEGSGIVSVGNYKTKEVEATVFFNSPYQILHWDIAPDWKGFYVIFSEEFYAKKQKRLTEEFSYLLVDNTIPLELSREQANAFLSTFQDIYSEFHADLHGNKEIIQSYLDILLRKVSRLFSDKAKTHALTYGQRDNDLNLVSRFKALIETSFYPDQDLQNASPHQVQFYANVLHIHPNHLNAVVKRITSHSASELIQKHVMALAKSKLRNSDKSVKEIAYELHYAYPNHFTHFFKKQVGITPVAFREQHHRTK